MSPKSALLLLGTVGSVAGGWLPTLFGAGDLSGWSVLGGLVGGLLGIWLGYKFLHS